MTINGLGPIDPVSKYKSAGKAERAIRSRDADSINVSDEAKLRSDMLRSAEFAKAAPEIREDRVAEVKKRLEDPNYLNDAVFGSVAEEIMKAFGI
jgi:negative regulator of flagellin synthesis FlgM